MKIRFDFGLDVQMLRCDGWELVAGNGGGGRVGRDAWPRTGFGWCDSATRERSHLRWADQCGARQTSFTLGRHVAVIDWLLSTPLG